MEARTCPFLTKSPSRGLTIITLPETRKLAFVGEFGVDTVPLTAMVSFSWTFCALPTTTGRTGSLRTCFFSGSPLHAARDTPRTRLINTDTNVKLPFMVALPFVETELLETLNSHER